MTDSYTKTPGTKRRRNLSVDTTAYKFVVTEVKSNLPCCMFCGNAPWSYLEFLVKKEDAEKVAKLFPHPQRIYSANDEEHDSKVLSFRINGCRHHAQTLSLLAQRCAHNSDTINADTIIRAKKRV